MTGVPRDRRRRLSEQLRRHGFVSVAGAASELGVSALTIRRDLARLVESGVAERVHGGAVLFGTAGERPADSDLGWAEAAAGALRASSDLRIGVLFPVTDYYYGAVLDGARRAASTLGCRLVYSSHDYRAAAESRRLAAMRDLPLDGLIVATSAGTDTDMARVHAALDDWPAPVVVCERTLGFPQLRRSRDWVASDHTLGAHLAVEHLATLGHRRVLLAVGPGVTAPEIERGARRSAETLGVSLIPAPTRLPGFVEDEPPPEPYGTALDRAEVVGCTAVIVHSDLQALTLLRGALLRGIDVPRELSIVAYDDERSADAVVPLTAVAPAKAEVGATAVELAARRVRDHRASASIRKVLVGPRLEVRASTAPPRH